jgi:hypothetical protein
MSSFETPLSKRVKYQNLVSKPKSEKPTLENICQLLINTASAPTYSQLPSWLSIFFFLCWVLLLAIRFRRLLTNDGGAYFRRRNGIIWHRRQFIPFIRALIAFGASKRRNFYADIPDEGKNVDPTGYITYFSCIIPTGIATESVAMKLPLGSSFPNGKYHSVVNSVRVSADLISRVRRKGTTRGIDGTRCCTPANDYATDRFAPDNTIETRIRNGIKTGTPPPRRRVNYYGAVCVFWATAPVRAGPPGH